MATRISLLTLLALAPGCAAASDAAPPDAAPRRDAPADVPVARDDGAAPTDLGPRDAPRDDAPRDAGLDLPLPDAAPPPRDASPVLDVTAPPACDGRFRVTPSPPGDDAPLDVAVTDGPGYVHVGLDLAGPGAPRAEWAGVTGTSPFTWRWRVTGHAAGRLAVRFTADMGARAIAACAVDVVARGGPRDAGAPDAGVDAGPVATPPANRFGVGLVGPGDAVQLDLAADLAGPGGHVKLIFPGVRPGMTAPPPEWREAVRLAYARDLVPVIRFGPPWEDRRVRNQSDDGRGRSYARLAAAYRDVVRGLPLRAGWPLYVEVHNEPNLCYEWQCDRGALPGDRITAEAIAAEYAALLRDVAAALHALGDARVRVVNGGLAPGGVRWCACVGTRDAGAGEWEGGQRSVDFLRAMQGAVPGVFASLDAFASHAYPASGEGFGFFVRYESAGPGLRYYRAELAAIGRALPVLLTETGWTTEAGDRGSRDDVARWTRAAYEDLWLADPTVRAVMPFQLQDAGWEGFAWVRAGGGPYPVYNSVRTLRCSRIAGRCP